ncbi:MAG: hypothetical protein R6U98_32725 [Pirellulaceae bacterium]
MTAHVGLDQNPCLPRARPPKKCILQAVGFVRVETRSTQAVLPLVGIN